MFPLSCVGSVYIRNLCTSSLCLFVAARLFVDIAFITQLTINLVMGSRPRYHVQYHYLVCIENHLFIVVIGPIINKSSNLFIDLIAMIIRAFIVRYQYCTINFRYTNVTKSEIFLHV